MSQLVKKAEQSIRQAVLEAIGRGIAAGELPAEPIPDFTVEVPADRSHGDYAVNAAMVSARAFRMPPRKIAECIQTHLELSGTPAQQCEVAGAGFLNFTLGDAFYASLLEDILERGDDYGRLDYGAGKRVNVEFVSAN
ncbi:MAG: arginine--tRNA ligase, partial [Clostridia bacterium]|nr:arginine--tRNA ligase [Clostridia bacterium]